MQAMIRIWGLSTLTKATGKAFGFLQKFQTIPEEKKSEKTSEKNIGTEPTTAEGAADHDFKVGDMVITSSGKNKDALDQKLARVTKVLSKKCKVEFLEGSAKATEKEFPKEKLTLKKEEASVSKRPLGTPAEQTDAAASKKQRAENLFGEDAELPP